MKPDAALKRKLRALQDRVSRIQALMKFLKKNPDIAAVTEICQLSERTALCFPDQAFIRTVPMKETGTVALRLERYDEDWSARAGQVDERVVCQDVSILTREELEKVLQEVGLEVEEE